MNSRGISVRSLTESCDAGTSSAQLMVHLMAALAKSERELIGEPTHARFAPHEREALGSDGRQALECMNGTPQSDASAPVTRARDVAKAHGMRQRTPYRILRYFGAPAPRNEVHPSTTPHIQVASRRRTVRSYLPGTKS